MHCFIKSKNPWVHLQVRFNEWIGHKICKKGEKCITLIILQHTKEQRETFHHERTVGNVPRSYGLSRKAKNVCWTPETTLKRTIHA